MCGLFMFQNNRSFCQGFQVYHTHSAIIFAFLSVKNKLEYFADYSLLKIKPNLGLLGKKRLKLNLFVSTSQTGLVCWFLVLGTCSKF